jgi:hypothetical protein
LCERGLLVLRGQGAGGPGTACRSRSGSPRRSWGQVWCFAFFTTRTCMSLMR